MIAATPVRDRRFKVSARPMTNSSLARLWLSGIEKTPRPSPGRARLMHRSRIAVLILVAILSAACADQSSRPSATPLAGAPAGKPLILFAGSNARAFTWSGREYLPANGIPQPAPSTTTGAAAAMPSPDGSSIVDEASPDRMWVRGTYVTGRPSPPSNLSFPTWADDSSRLCAISYNPDESCLAFIGQSAPTCPLRDVTTRRPPALTE